MQGCWKKYSDVKSDRLVTKRAATGSKAFNL
jgi:hypothetical protein